MIASDAEPEDTARMSCIELAAIGIKVILVTVGTITSGIGTTYLMSSVYCSGLLLAIAGVMLAVFAEKITSWKIGAPGVEHQLMLQLPVRMLI